MNRESKSTPKLTIGFPVYNGESFIKKRLENILSQTFKDFVLIISDDSTDSTPSICQEFANKDKRMHYIHQKKRMGLVWSFNFVLKQAKSEYFVWAGVDDKWTPDFLEKNIAILDSNKDVVGSVGKIERYGPVINEFKSVPNDSSTQKIYKKTQQKIFRHSFQSIFEAKGPFEKKAEKILRNTWYKHHNGLIRTSALKKSIIEKDMFLWDWSIVLNLIKYGDLHITKKSKYLVYVGETTSRQGIFGLFKSQKMRINEYLLPASTFTFWCMKNIGFKFFLKNIDYFIWLNFIHVVGILLGIHHKMID